MTVQRGCQFKSIKFHESYGTYFFCSFSILSVLSVLPKWLLWQMEATKKRQSDMEKTEDNFPTDAKIVDRMLVCKAFSNPKGAWLRKSYLKRRQLFHFLQGFYIEQFTMLYVSSQSRNWKSPQFWWNRERERTVTRLEKIRWKIIFIGSCISLARLVWWQHRYRNVQWKHLYKIEEGLS